MEINKYNLTTYLIKNYKKIVDDMMKTTHYVDLSNPNPYHAEGSIWTHSMCVLTCVDFLTENTEYRKILYLTALLHDIGKVLTKKYKEASDTKPVRYSFNNHEAFSFFYAIGILKDFQTEFDISNQDVKDVLTLIGLHGSAIKDTEHPNTPERLQTLRVLFRKADKNGAVRFSEAEGDYIPRKRINRKVLPEKEVLFMIGLPCAGKSTYVENLDGYVVLSRDKALVDFYNTKLEKTDDYNNEIDKDFYVTNEYVSNEIDKDFYSTKPEKTDNYNKIYDYIHDNCLSEFNEYFEKVIRTAAKSDKVVIDMTMMGLRARRKMLSKFPKHTANCVIFATPLSTIIERNKNRKNKIISEKVFECMMAGFTFPTHYEFETIDLKID